MKNQDQSLQSFDFNDLSQNNINQSQLDITTNFDESQNIQKLKLKLEKQAKEIDKQKNQLLLKETKIKEQREELQCLQQQLKECKFQLEKKIISSSENSFQHEKINENDILDNSWDTQLLQQQQLQEKFKGNEKHLQYMNKREEIQINREQELSKKDSILQTKYEELRKQYEAVHQNRVDALNDKIKEFTDKYKNQKIEYEELRKQNEVVHQNRVDELNNKIKEFTDKYKNQKTQYKEKKKDIGKTKQEITGLRKQVEVQNDQMELIKQGIKQNFNKDFHPQIFEEIKKESDQKIIDSFQNYQNLLCQHDQMILRLNTLSHECQQNLNCLLEPQIFKQINDLLEDRLQKLTYYQQAHQQLSYECFKEFEFQLDHEVFKVINNAKQVQIDKIQSTHKRQVSDLNDKIQSLIDDLVDRQQKIDNLSIQRNDQQNQIKQLKQQLENQKEIDEQNLNLNQEFLVNSLKQNDKKQQELEKQFNSQTLKIENQIQINYFQQKIDSIQQERKQIKQKNKQLEYQIQTMQQQIGELKQKTKEQEQKTKEFEQEREELKSQGFEYRDKISKLEIQLLNFQQKKQEQKKQESLKFLNNRLQQENENYLSEQLESKKTEIILLNQRRQQEMETKDFEIKTLKSLNSKLQEQQKQVQEQINIKLNEFQRNENNFQQKILILKAVIDFIIKKFKQIPQLKNNNPLFQLIFEELYDKSQNRIKDPFNNIQIMPQEIKCIIFQLTVNQDKLRDIAHFGHPPLFEQVINVSDQNIIQFFIKSIHPNKQTTHFEGYFIKMKNNRIYNLKTTNQVNQFFVRKLKPNSKYYPNNSELQELQYQYGNQQLVQFFMNEFNQLLQQNNLDYPNLQLPKIIFAQNQSDSKYLYIEEICEQQQNVNITHRLYINSLKYYSYYCSQGNYMITYMYINGNYIYDSIVSSKYSMLSDYDLGNEEIVKQSLELDPKNYNYEKYQQIMMNLVI
ncbi:hypothetical protein pb186bvf_015290 [Paramecium bursaria]